MSTLTNYQSVYLIYTKTQYVMDVSYINTVIKTSLVCSSGQAPAQWRPDPAYRRHGSSGHEQRAGGTGEVSFVDEEIIFLKI